MRNLYIDFDGVILDTLPPVYKLAKQLNLDYKTQTKEMSKLFSKIDWEELIDDSVALNDSVNAIKKLSESGKFNISILTHVNSLKEAKAKIKFLDGITNDLTSNLVNDLKLGKLDFIIFNESNIKESNLELLKLKELKQGFMYNPAFYKDDITSFKDLNKYPLILQKTQSNSRKLLDYISLNNNVILKPKMEVVSQDLITEFVNIGLGIGFVIIDLANKKFDNLKELHINKKIPNINIYLATNKSISLTFASKTFIKYLK